jgi:2-dehydropantoate 2-reductase
VSRIAVFGAGAIGCWIGGRLSAGGSDVTLIGRPRVIDTLHAGLRLSDLKATTHTAKPRLATSVEAARDADLVLVTVKAAQTSDAARELASVISPTTTVVSLQNGVRNVSVLRNALGNRVRAGMVPFNVIRPAAGHYHRASGGVLMFEASPLASACARANLEFEIRSDMTAVQWSKLVLNLNNAINALSNQPLAAELSDFDYRRVFSASVREAVELLGAAQQELPRLGTLPPQWIWRLLLLPDPIFRRVAKQVVAIDPTARSSMWDDLEAKRTTEIDYIQGEIVALAERLGRRAPINRALVRLVKEAEQGGKRQFSGRELFRAVTQPTA